MANATIDADGIMTITVNTREEQLLGPDGKQWLPCGDCTTLILVDIDVEGPVCEPCTERINEAWG